MRLNAWKRVGQFQTNITQQFFRRIGTGKQIAESLRIHWGMKKKDAMEEAAREIKNSRGKLGMLVAFSALAMVFALAGVVVQILSLTNILSL